MLRWNSSQSSHIMQQETKLSLWDRVKTKFLNFLKAQITASLSKVDMADWDVVGKVDVNMAICHAQALCMTHLHAQWTNERRRAPRLHPCNSSVLIRQVNVHSKWPLLASSTVVTNILHCPMMAGLSHVLQKRQTTAFLSLLYYM